MKYLFLLQRPSRTLTEDLALFSNYSIDLRQYFAALVLQLRAQAKLDPIQLMPNL